VIKVNKNVTKSVDTIRDKCYNKTIKGKERKPMSKKGKKKGCKYSLNRIVLATAIINLLIEIIELIQSISD
jgi:hypothetical protein